MSNASLLAQAIGLQSQHIRICLKVAAALAVLLLAAQKFLGWPVPPGIEAMAQGYVAIVVVLWLFGLPAGPPVEPSP